MVEGRRSSSRRGNSARGDCYGGVNEPAAWLGGAPPGELDAAADSRCTPRVQTHHQAVIAGGGDKPQKTSFGSWLDEPRR